MLVTDNEAWACKAKYLTTQAKDDSLESVHGEIGYNYRLTNIQAAIGCAQLEQLDEYIAAKRRIAERYSEAMKDIRGLSPMKEASRAFSIFWMYTILVDKTQFSVDSRTLLRRLERAKIQTRPLWQPLHSSPVYKHIHTTNCSIAERLNQMALSLPCSVSLSVEEQTRVIQEIRKIGGRC